MTEFVKSDYTKQDRKEYGLMKEVYEAPEMEVVYFGTEDIITCSGGDNDVDWSDTGWG